MEDRKRPAEGQHEVSSLDFKDRDAASTTYNALIKVKIAALGNPKKSVPDFVQSIADALTPSSGGKCLVEKKIVPGSFQVDTSGPTACLQLSGTKLWICASPGQNVAWVDPSSGITMNLRCSAERIEAAKSALDDLKKSVALLKQTRASTSPTEADFVSADSAASLLATHFNSLQYLVASILLGADNVAYHLAKHVDALVPVPKGKFMLKGTRKLIDTALKNAKKEGGEKGLESAARILSKSLGWDAKRTENVSRIVRDVSREDQDGNEIREFEIKISNRFSRRIQGSRQLEDMTEFNVHEIDGSPSILRQCVENHPQKHGLNVPRTTHIAKIGSRTVIKPVSFFRALSGGRSVNDGQSERWKLPAARLLLENATWRPAMNYDRLTASIFLNEMECWANEGSVLQTLEEEVEMDPAEAAVFSSV